MSPVDESSDHPSRAEFSGDDPGARDAGSDSESYHLKPGVLIGRFRLIEKIGRGGFGDVWKSRDSDLDREVAVKIPRQPFANRHEQDVFLREARAAGRLNHAGIVTIHDAGVQDGIPYIVSEFIPGRMLSEWSLQNRRKFLEIARVCRQIAAALDHAHSAGVIHRDLKPNNVIIDPKGDPRILDFGMAKREVNDVTLSIPEGMFGTPAYMSPEQACGDGRHVDRRTDIYTTGVILYEMLTGQLPFVASMPLILSMIVAEEQRHPRVIDRRIPRDLETICLKCLEKNPSARYGSAGELAADLRRFESGESILARPMGRTRQLIKLAKRRPAAAIGAVSLLMTSALFSAGILYYQSLLDISRNQLTQVLGDVTRQSVELARKDSSTRLQLYINDIRQAEQAWIAGDLAAMNSLLNRHLPTDPRNEIRGFEWHFLRRRCRLAPDSRIPAGHGRTFTVSFSPNGTLLASGGQNGLVAVHRKDGSEVWKFEDSKVGVESVCFSPDGQLLTSAGEDFGIRLREAADGSLIQSYPAHTTTVNSLAFSPDGKSLVSCCNQGEIAFWEIPSGKLIRRISKLSEGAIQTISFSPDGKRLATGCSLGMLKLSDLESGKLLWEFQHSGSVKHIAFAPGLPLLATAGQDNQVRIFTPDGRQAPFILSGFSDAVGSVAFSPDGFQLAAADKRGKIQVWDPESLQLRTVLQSPSGRAFSLSYAPQGDLLASGEIDGSISLWDLREKDRDVVCELFGSSGPMVFLPSRKGLVALIDNYLTLFQMDSVDSGTPFEYIFSQKPFTSRVKFPIRWIAKTTTSHFSLSPDGRFIAQGNRTDALELLDAETGKAIRKFHLNESPTKVMSLHFSADGSQLAVGTDDGRLHLWGLDQQNPQVTYRVPGSTDVKVNWTPEGNQLVCTGSSPSIVVIDPKSGSLGSHESNQRGPLISAAFSPDSRWLFVGSNSGVVEAWRFDTMTLERSFHPAHIAVVDLAVSPDGRTLAAVSNNRVSLWNIPTWQEMLNLDSRLKSIDHISFSPKGDILAISSTAGVTRSKRGYLSELEFVFAGRPEDPR